ncbi:hypothetical protein Z043_110455 [Scleropages formosus]|uniref:5' exonuclease Apollo n=1 Tax=Scleropages formosus TaxID=113540 RepID=A0A0P7X8D9_SCLFO|nr:hypothetical protein Z043_110455 [Scleropages formosus]
MNGKVIPNTPLAVDYWHVRKCSHVRLFFLSHAHSDHTCGLTSTWANRPLYCSPISAKLLGLKLQVKEKWIHPLEVGEAHLLPLDDVGKETLTVTLMDANHCPGAVMFLFQGYFGTILYTGDFRYTPTMLREPCLRSHTTIDVLYLDNTHCDPTRTLPSRQQATQQIKEIIRAHPGHDVVIGEGSRPQYSVSVSLCSLGKETLLIQLALEFRTWVEVRAASLLAWNLQRPTLAILPTGRPVASFHPNIHVVPYSDHSSFRELEDFVSALRPASLVPIVGPCVPQLSSLISPRKQRYPVIVPQSVRNCMMRRLDPEPIFPTPLPKVSRRTACGVVFESPQKTPCVSKADIIDLSEEMDISVDRDMDKPMKCCGNPVGKLCIEDVTSLDTAPLLSADTDMSESCFLSQLSHSDWVFHPRVILQTPAFSTSELSLDPELVLLAELLTFPREDLYGSYTLVKQAFQDGHRLAPVCPVQLGSSAFHSTVEHFLSLQAGGAAPAQVSATH